MKKDQIYASPREQVGAFRFDDQVAEVFSDMIQRSVPGYSMVLEMIGVITREFVLPNTRCYDLGCSLGAATMSIRHNINAEGCSITAVDNAEAMAQRCREIMASNESSTPVEVRCEDILNTEIKNASLIVMNFTLMFIEPERRLELLRNIYDGLNPGGVLILSDKMMEAKNQDQDILTDLYHSFKGIRGYSKMEIAQKRTALENVLIPETIDTHKSRLLDAGFSQVTTWFKCFGFTSLIALK